VNALLNLATQLPRMKPVSGDLGISWRESQTPKQQLVSIIGGDI